MNGQRVLVESSCVSAIAFSIEKNILHIEFRNGLVYEYFDVPSSLHQDLLSAPSKGAFVTRFIRGRFPFRRLEQSGDLTQ